VSESFLSSQSHLKLCRVRVRVTTWSCRVRVESQELSSHFESLVCNLESMSSHTKFHVFSTTLFCYEMAPNMPKMAPNKLENVAQYCFNKFDCRLFISKFSQFAFYFCLSLSVISESLAQPYCKSWSLSTLWWICDSPRKRCVWRTTPMCREQA